jgi:hypothetical protein
VQESAQLAVELVDVGVFQASRDCTPERHIRALSFNNRGRIERPECTARESLVRERRLDRRDHRRPERA